MGHVTATEPAVHAAVSAKSDAIAELCRHFHVRRLDVFGSAARDKDFEPQRSDADFMIEFEPDVKPTIALLLDVEEALRQTLGRPVDLVERKVIETSPNYLRRRRILREAEPLYVAG
jgi:predicted nucleotidyltransferase